MTPARIAILVGITAVLSALVLTSAAGGYAAANPLPWNGYGRTSVQVNDTFAVLGDSNVTVRILGNGTIPAGAFFFLQLGVMTVTPSGDPYEVFFRLSYDGVAQRQDTGWATSFSLETRSETAGPTNPEFYIQNDNAVDVDIERHAFLIVPPTTMEQFAGLIPLAILGTLLTTLAVFATLWSRSTPRVPRK